MNFNPFTIVESGKQISLRELECVFGWIVTKVHWIVLLRSVLLFGLFFFSKSPQTNKKPEEDNVLEEYPGKGCLNYGSCVILEEFLLLCWEGGGSHQFLHVPCSLLPPVCSCFSLQCDPGLL